MCPLARRSASAARTCVEAASGATSVIVRTSARMPTFASDLTLRTPARAAPDRGEHSGVAAGGSSERSGHGRRCTEPAPNHDHTSSVTYGTKGASRRSRVSSAMRSAARALAAAASP